jgi:hypothetical protein
VILGGVGTTVHGVQAVGAGVELCLEVGVIQGGVGTPVDGVQDVGAGGRVAGWGEVTRVCPDL